MGKKYKRKKLLLSVLEEIPVIGELFEKAFKFRKYGPKKLGKLTSCCCLVPGSILLVFAVAAIAFLASDILGVLQGSEWIRGAVEGAKDIAGPLNPLDEISNWLGDVGEWVNSIIDIAIERADAPVV